MGLISIVTILLDIILIIPYLNGIKTGSASRGAYWPRIAPGADSDPGASDINIIQGKLFVKGFLRNLGKIMGSDVIICNNLSKSKTSS